MTASKKARRTMTIRARSDLARYLDLLKPDMEKYAERNGINLAVARQDRIQDAIWALEALRRMEQ